MSPGMRSYHSDRLETGQRRRPVLRTHLGPWEKPGLIMRTAISDAAEKEQEARGKHGHWRAVTRTGCPTTCSGGHRLLKVRSPYLESQRGETAINREMWRPMKRQTDRQTDRQTHACLRQTGMQTRNCGEETEVHSCGSGALRAAAPRLPRKGHPPSRQAARPAPRRFF